jgi:hypothetical protein
MLHVGSLVKTVEGDLALVSNIDEVVQDRWGMKTINFVTLVHCDTGVVDKYRDARFLRHAGNN